jgi:hypothetical protein
MKILLRNRTRGWAMIAIFFVITAAFLLVLQVMYTQLTVLKNIRDLQEHERTNQPLPKVYLHWDFENYTNEQNEVVYDVPDNTLRTSGDWQILRSTDCFDWQVVTTLNTDMRSAEILRDTLFEIETNLTQMTNKMVLYKAILNK